MLGDRRLSVPPLVIMEGQGSGSLGSGGPERGISHPFLVQASSVRGPTPDRQLLPQFHQGESLGRRDSFSPGEGCSRASPSLARVLQPSLCRDEGLGNLAPHHRPVDSQQVCDGDQVQDGNCPIGTVVHQTGRLDGVTGFEGRVPSSPGPSGEQTPFEVRYPGRCLSVQGFVLWTDNLSSGLHTGDGSGFRVASQHGDQDATLFGRLARPSELPRCLFAGKGCSIGSLPRTRDHHKFREVESDSFSDDHLPGDSHILIDFEGFPLRDPDLEVLRVGRRISILQRSTGGLMEKAAGSSGVSDTASPRRQTQDEVASTSSSGWLGFSGRVGPDPTGSFLSHGSGLVDGDRSSGDGLSSAGGPPGPDVLVRRFRRRLGGSFAEQLCFRPLVCRRKVSVHQSQGTEGHSSRSYQLSGAGSGQGCRSLLRQCDSSVVPEESGGHSIAVPERRGSTPAEVGGVSPSVSGAPVHLGATQCPGGRSIQEESSDRLRMDPAPGGSGSSVEVVAGEYRPLRQLSQLQTPSVLRPIARSDECGNGRFPSVLGRLSGLRLPSFLPSSPGIEQGEEFVGVSGHVDRPVLAAEGVVPGPAGVPSGTTPSVARAERSSQTTALPPVPSSAPVATPSCLETIQRFTRHEGFSARVARQVSLARRQSTNVIYQHKWTVFRRWCRDQGCSISRPSLPKIADFLLFLHQRKGLSVSAIRGYRSMLSSVFRLKLPSIATSQVIRDLLRSFSLQRVRNPVSPPGWDLNIVLQYLRSAPFEPLEDADFRALSKKCLFLVALATAKRVSELQGLSSRVARAGDDRSLSYSLGFVAKTESLSNPLPRSFLMKSLKEFVGDMPEELLLCPVRALDIYLDRTKELSPRPHSLFVSPRNRSRPISKNAISFFLRETISGAGALRPDGGRDLRAHSIRGVSTSVTFARNWSVRQVLEAATWRSNTVFASYYLRDVSFSLDEWRSLGPIVSAGQVLNPSAPV